MQGGGFNEGRREEKQRVWLERQNLVGDTRRKQIFVCTSKRGGGDLQSTLRQRSRFFMLTKGSCAWLSICCSVGVHFFVCM